MPEKSKVSLEFIKGIADSNERTLAEEILEGKKLGEFSLNFDQPQIDAMTDKLKVAGCFEEEVAPVEEVEEEIDGEGSDVVDPDPTATPDQAPTGNQDPATDVPATDVSATDVPATDTPDAPAEGSELADPAPATAVQDNNPKVELDNQNAPEQGQDTVDPEKV